MSASQPRPDRSDSRFEQRLRDAVSGEVMFDAFSRGRYATDASIYQIMPQAVVTPRSTQEMAAALAIARDEGVAVTPRGGGTSQNGQTINASMVMDTTRYLNRVIEVDADNRRAVVEPGVVLDELNRMLKPHGLWFPVDVSTASRATIGGMAGNNSCGTRSLRYGRMRDNVLGIDARLADGRALHFGTVQRDQAIAQSPARDDGLVARLLELGAQEAEEIGARFPDVLRRVGGYNIDALVPKGPTNNLAELLVGSEGTLALFERIEIALSPVIRNKVFGVCHFPRFHDAMEAAQHLVTLDPIAVELVDRTMIELSRDIDIFRPTLERCVRGEPDALLIVEFGEEDPSENLRRLERLSEMMGDLGYSWSGQGRRWGGMVPVKDPALQAAITEVRQAGLNIMMSMKSEGKPVSFVEDCAVPLEHLGAYTSRLTEVFERHGTRGTWYAHASVGCLHVRPVLNLKQDKDVRAMRAIAEEAMALVRDYKGSHSGEHGDGISRSEFHEPMFGRRMVAAFETVKTGFDPDGVLNPGRIVNPPRMDDRSLMRFPPGYKAEDRKVALEWSAWPGASGGLQGAVEMCNNNGACRKLKGGAMCPSFRVTRNERDVTRGRANTLRLALSGQLGPDALSSDAMAETLSLCVSCKACKRECPTGVDMARMKIEVQAARAQRHGLSLRDRTIAYLPRYAPVAARLAGLMNLRNRVPLLARLGERLLGLSAERPLPSWRRDVFDGQTAGPEDGREVVLFTDTFNRHFEPENARAAVNVLAAAGFRVLMPRATQQPGRGLCCGRSFLAAGLVDQARTELTRTLDTLAPLAHRGVPILGLEPSCLMTLRDEAPALLPGDDADAVKACALLVDEFLAAEAAAGRLDLPLSPLAGEAHVHGHCHQKAFNAFQPTLEMLRLIPELKVTAIDSGCCGMAGAFGYQAETLDVSRAMAELSLLPAVRAAGPEAFIVADGTSCRHQIADGSGRPAMHAIRVLERAIVGRQDHPTGPAPAARKAAHSAQVSQNL
ncbi:FAD-binding protein [Rhodobacteraceae bacterium 2376]|uniref:D-2-hydroxyglutarate dehydrogenase n=1 Tax=Rhabdonatronobacter sediminivivens TaxID=2743469 RepID=A0A7Z0HXS1_9RHOB|nr:FAD-binding protein [Rhabdonatronobacter sediminivivens]